MPRSTPSEVTKLRAELERISSRLAELGEDSLEELEESAHSFMERGKQTGKKVQEYIEENPWHMLGIGAAMGFLLAHFLKRDRE